MCSWMRVVLFTAHECLRFFLHYTNTRATVTFDFRFVPVSVNSSDERRQNRVVKPCVTVTLGFRLTFQTDCGRTALDAQRKLHSLIIKRSLKIYLRYTWCSWYQNKYRAKTLFNFVILFMLLFCCRVNSTYRGNFFFKYASVVRTYMILIGS